MLQQGVDFKCVDKTSSPLPVCYGVGAAKHQLFQRLQQLMNRMSAPVVSNQIVVSKGFPLLAVDGLIGPATVAAVTPAAAVVLHLGHKPTPQIIHDLIRTGGPASTKEGVATHAPEIVRAFEESIAQVEARMRGGSSPRAVAGATVPQNLQRPQRTPSAGWLLVGLGLVAGIAWQARSATTAPPPNHHRRASGR